VELFNNEIDIFSVWPTITATNFDNTNSILDLAIRTPQNAKVHKNKPLVQCTNIIALMQCRWVHRHAFNPTALTKQLLVYQPVLHNTC